MSTAFSYAIRSYVIDQRDLSLKNVLHSCKCHAVHTLSMNDLFWLYQLSHSLLKVLSNAIVIIFKKPVNATFKVHSFEINAYGCEKKSNINNNEIVELAIMTIQISSI